MSPRNVPGCRFRLALLGLLPEPAADLLELLAALGRAVGMALVQDRVLLDPGLADGRHPVRDPIQGRVVPPLRGEGLRRVHRQQPEGEQDAERDPAAHRAGRVHGNTVRFLQAADNCSLASLPTG